MQQSYEALDRPGGFSRVRLFAPLAHRDYRLLAGGMSVSLLGDGLFLVALAWQVYTMSDAPTALATVGIAMTIPTIACLLIGGAVSDRFDRRLVMLAADAVRGVVAGRARGAHGLGGAPVLGAAVDRRGVRRRHRVLQPRLGCTRAAAASRRRAGSSQLARSADPSPGAPARRSRTRRLVGRRDRRRLDVRVGRRLVLDLGRRAPGHVTGPALVREPEARAGVREIGAGLRYVRSHPWLWATLVTAAIAYLLFMGPTEVLLPFIVKHQFADGARDLG